MFALLRKCPLPVVAARLLRRCALPVVAIVDGMCFALFAVAKELSVACFRGRDVDVPLLVFVVAMEHVPYLFAQLSSNLTLRVFVAAKEVRFTCSRDCNETLTLLVFAALQGTHTLLPFVAQDLFRFQLEGIHLACFSLL